MRYDAHLIPGPKGKGEAAYRRDVLDNWGVRNGSDDLEEFKKRVKKAAEDLFEYDTIEIWDCETEQRVMRFRNEIVGGYVVVKQMKG
ncbi:MAG: hypothetical protein ACETWM_13780 [Candidatus Lokiarchaeia archaeon]